MTRKEGITKYLTKLISKGIIDERTYRKQLEEINNANLMDLYYKQRANNLNPALEGLEMEDSMKGLIIWEIWVLMEDL